MRCLPKAASAPTALRSASPEPARVRVRRSAGPLRLEEVVPRSFDGRLVPLGPVVRSTPHAWEAELGPGVTSLEVRLPSPTVRLAVQVA